MKIQATIQKRKVKQEDGSYKEIVLNRNIYHPDHNGRMRLHTEDELREMKENIDEVIVEINKLESLEELKK